MLTSASRERSIWCWDTLVSAPTIRVPPFPYFPTYQANQGPCPTALIYLIKWAYPESHSLIMGSPLRSKIQAWSKLQGHGVPFIFLHIPSYRNIKYSVFIRKKLIDLTVVSGSKIYQQILNNQTTLLTLYVSKIGFFFKNAREFTWKQICILVL